MLLSLLTLSTFSHLDQNFIIKGIAHLYKISRVFRNILHHTHTHAHTRTHTSLSLYVYIYIYIYIQDY